MVDLAAYFARIGYTGPSAPELDTLRALHEAHVWAIPFENLNPLMGRPVELSPAALEAKIVGERRGGFCFEQNLLFADALEALGFSVTLLGARVWMGERTERPRTHALLRVDFADGPWIADVGFGGIGLLEPVPLRSGSVVELPLVSFRVQQEGSLWVMQSSKPERWFDLYGFTLEPQRRIDYELASHFAATHPGSPFTRMLFLARVARDKRLRLINRTLTVVTRDGTREQTFVSAAEAAREAKALFGLDVPADIIPDDPPPF